MVGLEDGISNWDHRRQISCGVLKEGCRDGAELRIRDLKEGVIKRVVRENERLRKSLQQNRRAVCFWQERNG